MATELNRYLSEVRENLRLDASSESEILSELETHAEERFQEMRETGMSDEEAARECVGLLGSARLVARQIYEAHTQGTWRQALLAALPHCFFAGLFLLRWWDIGWIPVILGLVAGLAVYGWGHGKPTWLFPWLGYSLMPVVIAGLLLLYLPTGWAWATILLYVPLILWLLCYITIKAINRDWLYVALMLLPAPSLAGWFLAARLGDRLLRFSPAIMNEFAPWIALSFLVLAVTATAFIRLRRRGLRVAVMGISGTITLLLVVLSGHCLGLPAFLALFSILLLSLIVPAALERRIRESGRPAVT